METQKQENSNSKKANPVSHPKPPVLQVDLKSIDKGMLQTAKSIGIPLDAILQYVSDLQAYNSTTEIRLSETETKLNAIIDQFEPAVKGTLVKIIKEEREKVQQAAPQVQQPASEPLGSTTPASSPSTVGAGNAIGTLLSAVMQNPQILQMIMGQVSPTANNTLAEKYNELMLKSLDAKIQEIVNPPENPFEKLGKALVENVIAKAGSKMANTLGETLAPNV